MIFLFISIGVFVLWGAIFLRLLGICIAGALIVVALAITVELLASASINALLLMAPMLLVGTGFSIWLARYIDRHWTKS